MKRVGQMRNRETDQRYRQGERMTEREIGGREREVGDRDKARERKRK